MASAGHLALEPPHLRDGFVWRGQLVERLNASTARVVACVAPAGYGKTTLLTQWAASDARPFAWMTMSEVDNDRGPLLAHLLLALEQVHAVPPEAFEAIVFTEADLVRVVLPRLGSVVAACSPFVLVVDDVHLLRNRRALDVFRAAVEHLPAGSCVAFGGRSEPALPLARWRAAREVFDVGIDDLAMNVEESAALLRAAAIEVDDAEAAHLNEVTEGWPGGLYLSTLAMQARDSDLARGVTSFGGEDRLVAEYFLDEVLRAVPDEHAQFLVRTSILDELCGPLCDAVLERSGSAALLDQLERSNLFVVALGRTREWYRYHHLFRDLLRAELRRREPAIEAELHRRASEWWEQAGGPDGAIAHARAGGQVERAAGLVWVNAPFYVGAGRTETVLRWLDAYPTDEITTRAPLALSAAWAAFSSGAMDDLDRWVSALRGHEGGEPLPDGTRVAGALALLEAILAAQGLTRVREDAAAAYDAQPTLSPFRSLALLLGGVATRLLGDTAAARRLLEEGLRVPVLLPPSTAHCLAQLALIATDEGKWDEAQALVTEALEIVEANHLEERPSLCEVYAAAALVHARVGRPEARDVAKHGAWLVTMLRGAVPFIVIEACVLLARTLIQLGDLPLARELAHEAAELVERYPDAGWLPELVAQVNARLDSIELPLGVAASPLTPAELRVLRYLPTHLSFAEIADEVYVSRNTVKTQAIAVYRKLGVGSRAAAVDAAREAGLLEV